MTAEATETKGTGESAACRIFLVVADDTEEFKPALEYASLRAKRLGGRVAILHVLPPVEFAHFMFVGEVMREDQRQDARSLLDGFAAQVREITGREPIVLLREGDRREELLKILETETIHMLVLGADPGSNGPGPLITSLTTRDLQRLHVPMTLIPGGMSATDIHAAAEI